MKITFKLVETHLNEETYTIAQLPDNWDELNRWEQYSYIGERCVLVDSYSELSQIEDVLEVEEEGDEHGN